MQGPSLPRHRAVVMERARLSVHTTTTGLPVLVSVSLQQSRTGIALHIIFTPTPPSYPTPTLSFHTSHSYPTPLPHSHPIVPTLRTPLSGTCLLKEVCRKPLFGVCIVPRFSLLPPPHPTLLPHSHTIVPHLSSKMQLRGVRICSSPLCQYSDGMFSLL